MALIAPSLLAADFARLAEALDIIREARASMVHVDVMDGHFVPDISVGQPVIESLRRATDLTLDVHLLIERPERYAAEFVEAGADRVAIHAEATPQLHRALDLIRNGGAKAGVALNPGTPLEAVTEVLGDIDFMNVLAADPSLRERAFIARSIAKICAAARAREEGRLNFAIQVEGGIGGHLIEEIVQAGADILVAGFAIFHNDDPKAQLSGMIRQASTARQTSRV
jgi:ribulose-phosphate 3-epimerase